MLCSAPQSAIDPAVFKDTERWDAIERDFWSTILEIPSYGFYSFDDNFFSVILNTREKFVAEVLKRTGETFSECQVESDIMDIVDQAIFQKFVPRFISILHAENFKYDAVLVSQRSRILGIVQESKYFNLTNPLSGNPLPGAITEKLLFDAACIAHEEYSKAAEELIARYQGA